MYLKFTHQFLGRYMAQKTVVTLVDDLEGGVADETVEFGLDGVSYTIDLSTGNASKLREALADFVAGARRTRRRVKVAPRRHGETPKPDREQAAAIREWGRRQGYKLADRGRIPANIAAMYHEQA